MKKSRQFWVFICFVILSALPFVSVGMSFMKIRAAVVMDQEIEWTGGKQAVLQVPKLEKSAYELRLESAVSDWQPLVELTWQLRDKQTLEEIVSLNTPEKITLTRPIGKIQIAQETSGENELVVNFINSNPTNRKLRIKLAHDRDALLAESSKEFGIVLAISLVLSLLLWKPLMAPVRHST